MSSEARDSETLEAGVPLVACPVVGLALSGGRGMVELEVL